jgi:hypothetical protein
VKTPLATAALLFALSTAVASAAKIDASLVPDGLYTAVIEKVADGAHMTVKMENGVEVDLRPAKHTVVFTSAMENTRVKLYIMQGEVIALSKS